MITLFSGIPGSGKSYKMVADIWKNRGKFFIIHNVVGFKTERLEGMGFEWIKYINENNITVEDFFSKEYQSELAQKIKEKYKRNMLVVIDESHEWFDRNVKNIKMWLSYHRHLNQTIYLVAHASRNIPQTYRSFIELEYRAKSSSLLFVPGVFMYNRLVGGQGAGYIFERKKKEIFELYKSADVKGSKEIAKKSLFLPVAVIAIVAGITMFVTSPKWIFGVKNVGKKDVGVSDKGQVEKVEQRANKNVSDVGNMSMSDVVNVNETAERIEEKFAYVGQFNGNIVLENRKNGNQYNIKKIPEISSVLLVDRNEACTVSTKNGEMATFYNYERYRGNNGDPAPEARHQSANEAGEVVTYNKI